MTLDFVKMNGAGNDFILIDNRAGQIKLTTEQIVRLCNRQRGIKLAGLTLVWLVMSGNEAARPMFGHGPGCEESLNWRALSRNDRWSLCWSRWSWCRRGRPGA